MQPAPKQESPGFIRRLCPNRLGLRAVVRHVEFGGLRRVIPRVMQMSLSGVRVMGRCFVVSRFVVFCSFAMMPRRVFVVLGRLSVMLCRLL